MKLTTRDYTIIRWKAKQAQLEYDMVVQRVYQGKVTIKEIMQGILGIPA